MTESIDLGGWRVSASRDGDGKLTVEVLLAGAPYARLALVPGSEAIEAAGGSGQRDAARQRRLRADMDL